MTDTDSLMYELETEIFYQDVKGDVHTWFDTNYPKDHASGIEAGINEVLRVFKEADGLMIVEFFGLRPKCYSFLTEDRGEAKEEKKCMGIKKAVVKKGMSHENYLNCLRSGES